LTKTIFARTQLLYAVARTGSAATSDVYRLAAASASEADQAGVFRHSVNFFLCYFTFTPFTETAVGAVRRIQRSSAIVVRRLLKIAKKAFKTYLHVVISVLVSV